MGLVIEYLLTHNKAGGQNLPRRVKRKFKGMGMVLNPIFVLVEILVYPQEKIETSTQKIHSANYNLLHKLTKTERM
jgi:mRNA-degrading endonuclease RelE of RelBE toxin-antitoxin system